MDFCIKVNDAICLSQLITDTELLDVDSRVDDDVMSLQKWS